MHNTCWMPLHFRGSMYLIGHLFLLFYCVVSNSINFSWSQSRNITITPRMPWKLPCQLDHTAQWCLQGQRWTVMVHGACNRWLITVLGYTIYYISLFFVFSCFLILSNRPSSMQSRNEWGKHLSLSIHLKWKVFILSLNLVLAVGFTYCGGIEGEWPPYSWVLAASLVELLGRIRRSGLVGETLSLGGGLLRFQSTDQAQSHSVSNLGVRM